MFYLSGIVIDLFLVMLLASKKNKSEADIILMVWLFMIGLHLLLYYFFISKWHYELPHVLGVNVPFPLIHGPFLLLYTSSLTNQVGNRLLRFLHFLPLILGYLLMIPFFLAPAESKIYTYEHKGAGFEWIFLPLDIAVMISGVVYVALSLIILRKHRKNVEDQFSNTDKINLNWLRYLILGMLIIWIAVIFTSAPYIYAVVVLYVIFIGFFGIKQTAIFAQNTLGPKPIFTLEHSNENGVDEGIVPSPSFDENPFIEKEKYLKSGLGEHEKQEIHIMLTNLMKQDKPFTNPELTLGEIAEQLRVHPNKLSQVINSVTQKNFYDYINSWRVDEFIHLVNKPDNMNYTLLSIAFECGFNSKSSFNRNFRKITGLSPSEYLKEHLERLTA